MPGKITGRSGFHNIKLLISILTGKILIFFTRYFGHGGTTLPGRTALKIAPNLLKTLSGQLKNGNILITGTNGKTTTASLIRSMLHKAGLTCIHNQSGSNLSWGIASAMINHADLTASLNADYGILEVDEGAFPSVVSGLLPRGIIITNIFRDQLDRYGEIDSIQRTIQRGITLQPSGGFMAINADDPTLAILESEQDITRLTYGLEIDLPADLFHNSGRDTKSCPFCLKLLHYEKIYFAHLGHYYCPDCSFKRPEPDIKLVGLRLKPDASSLLKIKLPREEFEVQYPLIGIYNLYNALAAITCAHALKIDLEAIQSGLQTATPSFGRMESFKQNDRSIIMALIKNPVGANEVLRTLLANEESIELIIAINDKIADGTDISWLWDVDFEQLASAENRISKITVSGSRAWDMAVRLKYAALNPSLIQVEKNTARAIKQTLKQDTVRASKLIILPSYTAMLEIRQAMNQIGLGRPYWEEQ